MLHWEYRTIYILYDKKKLKNWVLTLADRPPLVGMSAILSDHGTRGWELVSLEPERLEAYPGFGKWTVEPMTYRATFKRPKDA